jgi:HSP20 family molecular chaperone IbpA
MSTHFLERFYNPYDLLFRNLFEAETAFIPATEAKHQYPINIFEDDLGLTFELACTGIPKDAIEIKLEGDSINFSYDKAKTPDPERKYIHRGIAKRSFNLAYKLGTKFNPSKATANFNDGLLVVTVPFAQSAKPKVLKIN